MFEVIISDWNFVSSMDLNLCFKINVFLNIYDKIIFMFALQAVDKTFIFKVLLNTNSK